MAGAAPAGSTALVVGGTRGIGRATAVALAARGRRVGIVGRDHVAGGAVVRAIADAGGHGVFLPADVSSMRQVVELAARVHEGLGPVSALVHTAGVLRRRRVDSVDGIEISFAVNYLSRFLLNHLLEPDLRAAAPARIVQVGSFPGPLDVTRVPPPAGLSSFAGHGVGQRANSVYTLELARRLAGTDLTVTTINPGVVDTGIQHSSPDLGPLLTAMTALTRPWASTPEAFAAHVVGLAVGDAAAGVTGALFGRTGRRLTPRPAVADPDRGRELWERSAALVRPFLPAGTPRGPS